MSRPVRSKCPLPILAPEIGSAREDARRDPRFNESLARGLELLRAFTQGKPLLTNGELSELTELPKATVSRLTYTLTQLGYLSYAPHQEKYELGTGVLSLGFGFLANLAIRKFAKPLMKELANQTQAGIGLADRDRLEMVYVEYCTPDGVLTFRQQTGDRLGLLESAAGRAYWAALPKDEQDYFAEHINQADPDLWQRYQPVLQQSLEDYQQLGFCRSIGDWKKDINGIAVPLLIDCAPVHIINCGGPAYRISADFLENEAAPLLISTVNNIQSMLISQS